MFDALFVGWLVGGGLRGGWYSTLLTKYGGIMEGFVY